MQLISRSNLGHAMYRPDSFEHMSSVGTSYCQLPECRAGMEVGKGDYCSTKCSRREQLNYLAPPMMGATLIFSVSCLGFGVGLSCWAVLCVSLPVLAKTWVGR